MTADGMVPAPSGWNVLRGRPRAATVWVTWRTWATFSRMLEMRRGRMMSICVFIIVGTCTCRVLGVGTGKGGAYQGSEVLFVGKGVHLRAVSNGEVGRGEVPYKRLVSPRVWHQRHAHLGDDAKVGLRKDAAAGRQPHNIT